MSETMFPLGAPFSMKNGHQVKVGWAGLSGHGGLQGTGCRAALISLSPPRGRTRLNGRLAPVAHFFWGPSSGHGGGGACRGEGTVVGEHVPDRLGEPAGEVDLGDSGAALLAEPTLGALVALGELGAIVDHLREAETLAQQSGIVFKASGATTPLQSLNDTAPDQRPWAGCQRPWTLSYVTANGNVLPCCISPWTTKSYRNLVLGNAFTTSFGQIWNGERYQQFRQDFETDCAPDPCHGCGWLWSF